MMHREKEWVDLVQQVNRKEELRFLSYFTKNFLQRKNSYNTKK